MSPPEGTSPRGLTRLIGAATLLTYFNIAYCIALVGPTLLDFIQQTNVSWDMMGVLLMGRAGCTVLGNILAGLLADRDILPLLLIQTLSHSILLVAQIFLPLCSSQTEVILVFVVQGVVLGTNNNLSNLLTLTVQGGSSHAWMQGLFMAYSAAILLAPIVATPFLSQSAAQKQSQQSCNVTVNVTAGSTHFLSDAVDIRVPYWSSVLPCSVAIILLLLSVAWTKVAKFKTPDMAAKGPGRTIKPSVVAISFCLALLYFTLEGVCGRFLFSFAVKSSLCVSVWRAGMVVVLYGGATFIMRGSCAALAAFKPTLATPVRLLTANHVALSVALIAILIGRDNIEPMLWIFAFCAGIGVSNGFPSMMALMKTQGATTKVLSILPIGGGIGITLGPLITTYLMNDNVAGPGPGFYTLFCIIVHIATLLFGSLMTTLPSSNTHQVAQREQNVSVSYGKNQGIIVNDNLEEVNRVSEEEVGVGVGVGVGVEVDSQ